MSNIVAQRRLALSTFRRNPIPDNLTALENKNLIVKKELSRAKSANWREFCNSTNESTSLSDMWRRMRWIKGYRKNKFQASDEKKHELLCNLAPDYVRMPKPNFISKDSAPGNDNITDSVISHNSGEILRLCQFPRQEIVQTQL